MTSIVSCSFWPRRWRPLQRKIFRQAKFVSPPSLRRCVRCRWVHTALCWLQLWWKRSGHVFLGRGCQQTWPARFYSPWWIWQVSTGIYVKNKLLIDFSYEKTKLKIHIILLLINTFGSTWIFNLMLCTYLWPICE